jgi:hypothetical protein
MQHRFAFIIVALTMVAAVNSTNGAGLTARFLDPDWDGKTVPKNHICKLAGGKEAMSPRIQVENIPAGTTKIVVAFNDESNARLSTDGGHGKISVAVPEGATSVVVPSVPSESEVVPPGVKVEAKHRSTTPGYYLAPCSRGRGHMYAAEIIAVKSGTFPKSEIERIRLQLGVY